MATFTEITPTLQMVSDLVRTRLVTEGGHPADIFNEDTYPTDEQAQRLIDQAANAIWTQLPGSVAEPWAGAGQHLAALYAAILIEGSYFREQLTDDQVQLYRDLLMQGIRGLGAAMGAEESGPAHMSVDTVLQRSVMTIPPWDLYALDYPTPLPEPEPEPGFTLLGSWTSRTESTNENPLFDASFCLNGSVQAATALYITNVSLDSVDQGAALAALAIGDTVRIRYPQSEASPEQFVADYSVVSQVYPMAETPVAQYEIPVVLLTTTGDASHYGEDHAVRVLHPV